MNSQSAIDRCLSFINCQLQQKGNGRGRGVSGVQRRAVTISRQAGTGAHAIAENLAAYLQSARPGESAPWKVFDRDLVEQVLLDHNLPERLAQFMPEDHISEFADVIDQLCGLHPPSWTLVRKTVETILHLAQLGNVILIGRGATVITSRLDHVFHVRLLGSLEKRLARVQEVHQFTRKEALAYVRREDFGRRRYVKKYFNQDIADLLLYHLAINTDLVPPDKAAEIIGDAVLRCGQVANSALKDLPVKVASHAIAA
jgi:cytidylate kinase